MSYKFTRASRYRDGDTSRAISVGASGRRIAEFQILADDPDAAEANANLFIAAPAMYRLLQQINQAGPSDIVELTHEAGAVLAKARGES